ncbi:MAG: hypothetical protein M3141_02835 [Actinomycetota bacterium]|nr:hypothetical protein [Actinomycetota bacterium]
MRWPWTGVEVEEELRQLDARLADMQRAYEARDEQYALSQEYNRAYMRECVGTMQQAAARQERALAKVLAAFDQRTADIVAEGRAQREALFRMLDRLGPAPDET